MNEQEIRSWARYFAELEDQSFVNQILGPMTPDFPKIILHVASSEDGTRLYTEADQGKVKGLIHIDSGPLPKLKRIHAAFLQEQYQCLARFHQRLKQAGFRVEISSEAGQSEAGQ
jgi:catechol-2,3-dioxygenase